MSSPQVSVAKQLFNSGASFRQLVLLAFPFLFIYQNPELRQYFDIQPGPKIYHYFLPLFFGAFLPLKAVRRMTPLWIFAAAVAFNLVLTRQISQHLVNFLLFMLTCVSASAVQDDDDRWFRAGCWIAVSAILLNMLVHLPEIMSSGADNAEDRAIYPTLLAAGVNIELSTLVLLIIYAAPRAFFRVTGLVFILYAVFGTRAILIIWLIFVVCLLGPHIKTFLARHWGKLLFGALGVVVAVLAVFADKLEFTFLDRILEIGKDPGSIGRLMLYEVAFSASDCFAFGCGLGSATEIIQNTRIANFFEDNFHNVYLQLMVELGVPGLLAYLNLLLTGARQSRLRHDIGLFICVASIAAMSFIQFTGYEIITAYFLGRALHGFRKAAPVNYRLHERAEPLHGQGVRDTGEGGGRASC